MRRRRCFHIKLIPRKVLYLQLGQVVGGNFNIHILACSDSCILTQKGNARFTFMSVYSKRMQLFYSILFSRFASVTFNLTSKQCYAPNKNPFIANNNAASTSTYPTSKVTKSICRVSSIFLNCRRTSLSRWTDTAELLWLPGVFLAVSTAVINMSRKSYVTKRQSRPCIHVVTRRRCLVGRSVWTPVTLNISQRCLIVWDVFSDCQEVYSMPNSP